MTEPDIATMQSKLGPEHEKSQGSSALTQHSLWSVDLRLSHLDWSPEATLIHFQGRYPSICELDYNILQQELQNVPKTKATVDVADFCLVEDVTSARWFRGRVQNRKEDSLDVFLIDCGNVLSVDVARISSCSDDLFILPPKIVSGFLANMLILQSCSHSVVERYFSTLIGKTVTGFIQALLPHKVLLFEAPDINSDMARHGFGRHVDRDTFLLLVSMLTEVPLKQNMEPVPDLLIEKSRGQEFCYKSSSLQGYQDILSFCGPKLSFGTCAKVRVTAAVHSGLFYCQIANAAAELWQVSKKLAEICEGKTKGCSQKTPENLGVLCAVKGKDQRWYRGFVQLLPANSQVRVFFVDYGFFETAKIENVHSLPPELYSMQIMAFPCTLPSHADQDMVFRSQQLGLLKAGLLGAVLDVEINGFDKDNHVYTITILSDKDTHVDAPQPIQNLPSEPLSDVEEPSPQDRYVNYEPILGEALSKTLEAEEFQVGSGFMGYVEHAQDPNHFWIRTQKRNQEFEEMMTKIGEHFNQMKLDEDVLLKPEVGAMCCALYDEDFHFYRGVVIDVLEHGAEILFIDYGNIEKVPRKLMKNIPKTFASTSPFAICCTLVNVFPLDDVWPSATCQFFRKAVLGKAFLVHLIQMKKTKFVVDLFEIGSNNSITELLISSRLVEYIPHVPVEKNKDVLDKARQLQRSETNMSRKSEEGQDCKGEVNMCRNETEKNKVHSSYKALKIKPGFEVSVHCSHINSPSDFWCQPLDGTQALEKLMDDIQLYYSAHTVPLQPEESCCVAKSPEDGSWYRGLVIGNRKSHVVVMLVDYGSVILVTDNHLQAIMPEYLRLEGQAFRCSLYNLIEPADPKYCGDWSPHACNLLKSFALNSAGVLKCKVLSLLNVKNKGLCNVVSLHNIQTQQSITNTLIEQGLARVATSSTRQNSDVFPESFIYSSFDISLGDEERVYVTHISSQCEVYCHLERNTEIIEELETKIIEASENMQARRGAVVTKMCLAKYLDGKWYRGVTLPVQSSLHVGVFFIDYGNTNISEKKSVMFIPRSCEDLLYTPMQAIRFNLHSVPTEELYADTLEWLISAVLNKLVRVIVRGKRDDGSFDVELFDGEININEKIKEIILSLSQKPKTAVRFPVSWRKTKKQNTKCSRGTLKTPLKGQSVSLSKVLNGAKLKNTKNPAFGRSPNRKARAKQENEQKTRRTGPIKPQIMSTGGNQLIKPKQTQHRKEKGTPQMIQFPDKSINPGFRAKCFVSHIDSISSFFLQLSDDESAILKMGEDLNSSDFKGSLKVASPLRVSDVVLSEFEEDGALYRSVVKNQEDGSSYKVEFVDYGNSAVVGKKKIYSLPEEFLSQPRFSILCSLMNTSTYKDEASFIESVMENPLMVEFVRQYGVQWQVKVEVIDGEGERDATLGSTSVAKRDEETLSSLSDFTPNTSPCKKNLREEGQQRGKSRQAESTIKSKSLMPEPSAKQNVRTTRLVRRKPCSRGYRKSKTFSVPVSRDHPDASLYKTIQVRDTETGTILSVQSDSSFYVRLTKKNNLLTSMEIQIMDNIKEYKTMPEKDVKQDLKCLVQAEDGKWRRAVVQQIQERRLEVFLVDHGITEEIPRGPVPQQSTYLKKIPNLALLCKMNSLGFSKGKAAHQCRHEMLTPLVGTEVRLIFVSFSETDKVWLVEIIQSGLLPMCEIKASLHQNGDKSASADEAQSETSPDGLTTDASTPQLLFAPLETDKAYSGFASAFTTPFEFCVVLEDLLLVMDKVSIMLDNLPGNMPPLPEAHLVPGACCLVKSDSKNKWCRAEIVHADTTVVLKLVDYGHHECIPYQDLSKLKQLPLELANVPKMTYPCILRGVKPAGVDGGWSDEAAAFFQDCLYKKDLQIFFREFSPNSIWRVDIVADGLHIAKKLVDAGHANYVDVLLGCKFQELSSCKQPQVYDADEEEVYDEVEATDGCEANTSVNTEPRSSQCFLM